MPCRIALLIKQAQAVRQPNANHSERIKISTTILHHRSNIVSSTRAIEIFTTMSNTPRVAGYLARHRHSVINRMLRVNHAGELGADRIYHGQSFVLNNDPKYGPIIQNMWNQEKEHLEEMEYMNLKYRTRKSVLEPLWSIGGFIMGSVTATMGQKSAMTCTVAVENVITQHYNDQIRDILTEGDAKESEYMLDKLSKFRDDEQHHHDTAKEHERQEKEDETNPNLSRAIDAICRASIKIAEKT